MGIGKLLGQPIRPAAAVPGGSAADEPDQFDMVPPGGAQDHLDPLPIVMTLLPFVVSSRVMRRTGRRPASTPETSGHRSNRGACTAPAGRLPALIARNPTSPTSPATAT